MNSNSRHQCLIYSGPPSHQLPFLAATIQQKLKEGYRCLYLNNPPMISGLRSYLSIIGTNVIDEVAKSRLILSSDSGCTADGVFDSKRMLNGLESAVDQALRDGYKGLFATGDMTWEFGHEKNFDKLMEYEYGLEDVFQRRPELQGICQYHRDQMPAEVARQGLLTHQSIFVNETLSRVNPCYVSQQVATPAMAASAWLDEEIAGLCH